MDQASRMAADPTPGALNLMVYAIDIAHNARINRLVSEYGFPTTATIGPERLQDFWLIVQHQDDDIALQKACLEQCDFGPEERALLTDRVLVNQGHPQRYGTQMMRDAEGKRIAKPIEDVETVDQRRAELGLKPLAQYLAEANNR